MNSYIILIVSNLINTNKSNNIKEVRFKIVFSN